MNLSSSLADKEILEEKWCELVSSEFDSSQVSLCMCNCAAPEIHTDSLERKLDMLTHINRCIQQDLVKVTESL